MIVIILIISAEMVTVMIADDDNKPYRIRRRTLLREARRGQYVRSEGCPAVNYTKTSCTQPRVGAVDGNLKSTSCPHFFTR